LFLFQLLKLFPGNLEWVGAVVFPGILVGLLMAVPFLSRGAERRPRRRPIGVGIVAVLLASATALTVVGLVTTPPSEVVENGTLLTSAQLRGKQLIDQQACRACHIIDGEGETKGPRLDGIADRMAAADVHFFIEKPNATNPAATMKPMIPPLSHEDVDAITQYLLTLPADIPLKEKQ
jgi:cytochrome c553